MPPATLLFDPALIARYDVDGPRYTSYPAAPHFQTGYGESEYLAATWASNSGALPRPLSIYAHIPFCFSPCFYCGCLRIITRDRTRADRYVTLLSQEMQQVARSFPGSRKVVQLHLGGGTPNFLDARQMNEFMAALHRSFSCEQGPSREFGIEIDPRQIRPDYVPMLAGLGFNRLSLGVQDFEPGVQAAVNRIQSVEETRAIVDAAREHGFQSVNIDLIYGLPHQTVATFANTLDQVLAMRPDRVAAYGYAHLPERFVAQRRISSKDLPDASTRLALLGLTIEKLTSAGYCYIGMDHFALPDDDLSRAQREGTLQRNFQGYSTNAQCDQLGFGISAIGRIGDTFVQNEKNLAAYTTLIEAGRLAVVRGLTLDADDRVRGDLIQRLMCDGSIDIRDFQTRHQITFGAYFADELKALRALVDDGIVSLSDERIDATPRGRLLLRTIAMHFDRYLKNPQRAPVRYSRAL